MTITKNENDEKITILLEGRLDKLSSPILEEEMNKEIEKKKNIVIDFKNLEYISSAGLRILIASEKELKTVGKSLEIINVNDDVMNILNVTGFIYILNIKR
ncbi:MAG: STAS domain-containing protein [Lachnospiraceae bacterium]|nr:STAS domain-containing protein [Lachnospiraceae bacterium]